MVERISCREHLPAYLVGGFVRDLILMFKNLDLDIVVEADAIRFAQALTLACNGKIISHKRFGTATVVISHRLKIDFATARKETYPQPASLPLVTPGSLKDDLLRRDFTINAMAIALTQKEFGKLVDLFNGQEDLNKQKIRILHDLSFIDDPTRILRAIRFEQRYNFKIEPRTLSCLKEAVRLGMLEKVQPQRLRDELILILKEADPLRVVKRINELCGFGFLIGGGFVTRKTYTLFKSLASQIAWFNQTHISRRQLDVWVIYLMVLLESCGLKQVKHICRRYVFRKGEGKRLLDYKKIKPSLVSKLSKAKIRPSLLFKLLEPLSYEVILLLKAKYKNPNLQKNIRDFLKKYNGVRIYTSGRHLREFGLEPGPRYQKIFGRILNARLDGLIKTQEQELTFVKKLLRQK